MLTLSLSPSTKHEGKLQLGLVDQILQCNTVAYGTSCTWYLALVSKSGFWYHDSIGPVWCECIELALNCSAPTDLS